MVEETLTNIIRDKLNAPGVQNKSSESSLFLWLFSSALLTISPFRCQRVRRWFRWLTLLIMGLKDQAGTFHTTSEREQGQVYKLNLPERVSVLLMNSERSTTAGIFQVKYNLTSIDGIWDAPSATTENNPFLLSKRAEIMFTSMHF